MNKYDVNRKNLYDDLINMGYFRDEDGSINFSLEDFCEGMSDEESVRVLYSNLIEDGFYRDENGEVTLSEEDFVKNLVEKKEKREYYPLTENQRGLYVDWDLNPDALQYNIPSVKKMEDIDAETLRQALVSVVNAHPYMKTHMAQKDEDIVQLRLDDDEPEVLVTELSAEPDSNFFQSRVRPFDLLNDHLYRLEIYNTPKALYLFTDFHHIIFDGVSTMVFSMDLQRALAGETLEEESYSAFDNALEEQAMVQSEKYDEAEKYFDGLLSDFEVASYPHSVKPDTQKPGNKTANVVVAGESISKYCQQQGVTLNSFFMANVMQVMHRLLREKDLFITSISNGRESFDLQNAVGMFVKTLPVVSHANGQTVKDAVKDMQQQYLETQDNEIYSYTKIVEKYNVRSEVLFAFQGGVTSADDYISEESDEPVVLTLDTVKMPLMIQIFPKGNDFVINLEYDSSLYCNLDMKRLGKAMKCFLEYAAANPDVACNNVPLVDEEDKKALLELGKGEELAYDKSETLVDLFRKQAAATPDSVAVVYNGKSFTYSELDKLTDRLAVKLASMGVKPEMAVGVMIDRSEYMFVYPMAIMKAGGAYMPLDSHFPEERLSYMCEDAGVDLILADDGLVKEAMPSFKGRVFEKSEMASLPEVSDNDVEALPKAQPNNMYVVLYTSGSTGKPKGCVLEHHNIVNFCHWYVHEFNVTAKDRSAAYANFGFDAHMMDLYPVLSVGASVYIIPSDMRLDLAAMNDYIEENKLTISFFTTQIGIQLATLYKNSSFRTVSIGGEKYIPIKKPAYDLYNGYGPTECTLYSTTYKIKSDYEDAPIGKPLANYRLYIVDASMNLVPRGCAGELCVAGEGVSREYLNNPEMTQAKYVVIGGERMYRTGDLVRWNDDGDIVFLGRIDNQVKLRGLRIELGEIEARALQLADIKEVCVDVKEIGGMQNLVCYYSEKEGCQLDDEKLRNWLSETLTDFMVPEIYVKMDTLPLTPNGKVNRRALPVPEVEVDLGEIIAPETEQEKQLFDIVSVLLKTSSFGVTTNLITVGMTSLSAMRLSAIVNKEMGLIIPTKQIMKNPTIRGMINCLDEDYKTETTVFEKRDYYPITENQRGIILDWEMNRETTQYNIPSVRKIKNIDADTLAQALEKVVKAHPYVNTHFEMKDGDVVQLCLDNAPANITIDKLEKEPTIDFLQGLVRPFDLFNGPLYRLEIYQTESAVYLFQDFHHSIFDGVSDMVFMQDLKTALQGLDIEQEQHTYFEHAVEEEKMMHDEAFTKAESYFDNLLSSAESTVYPHSSEGTTDSEYGKFEFKIPSDSVENFSRVNGVTANAYFLTIFTQVLHRITREESVLISTIDNGRPDVRWMNTFGMFVKTYPIVSTLNIKEAHSTTIAAQTKTMQEQLLKTEENGFYPFTYIAERHHIRPEILFVFHGNMMTDEENTDVETIKVSPDTVKMPLTLTLFNNGSDNYTALLIYNPKLYSEADMKRLASAFRSAALNSLNTPSIADISMLSETDEAQLENFHSTAKSDIPYTLFYQPIEENAVKYADRVALIAKDRTLTFAELNVEANRVAHALMRKGVKRGDRVVLLLPRRSAVIVSMFGVSKTGAAYIPCDPAYPADRINLILTDSEAQYVITTKEHLADYPEGKGIDIDDIYMTDALPGDDENPGVDVSPEDLAYLIYTSGSTGRPKGVMLRHIGIANYLYDHPANVHIRGLKELDVKSFVSITTLSFDMSLKEFAGSLFNGITSILADEQEVMDASLLAKLMNKYHAEGINGTCSRLLTYMELDEFCEALSHCKVVWSGGEKYPMTLLTKLQKMGVHIFNTYGPTEITVSSNIKDLTHSHKVTVGHPLLNYEEFIVDIFDNELPQGFTGELLIGGLGVAKGYNNLPEMTEQRFVEYKGIRVYRSGDLACWQPDGDVEILGRNDSQVKLRGFRVELGEIEGLASTFDGIMQVVADVKEIGSAQHLCLYYTSDKEIDSEELKEFLANSLTEYMVPTVYMQIDSIPLTPNGKTNRKALPIPQLKQEEIIAPETPEEEQMLDVVKQLLKLDELGVTTNLVPFGLSSIASMRLSAMLLQRHGVKLAVKDILEHPTVREMVALSETADKEQQLKPYPVQECYPMSESQKGMFVDWMMNPNGLQYNIPILIRYKELDIERIKQAIQAIGEAHPYIKARLEQRGESVVQVRNDDAQMIVEEEVLDFEPTRQYFQEHLRPFDLLHDVLYRFKIYTTPSYYYLFFDIHHVISDGTSNFVLAHELERAYRGEQLKKEEYTAFDRAIDEEKIMLSERGKKAEEYFDNLVGGIDATVYPHSATLDNKGIYGQFSEEIESKDIEAFCQKYSIAPSCFFLTVFHNVLHRVTREDNTLVYFISNGRSEIQFENFFGVLVKTMPTVFHDFNSDVASAAKAMHKQMLNTISYDFYPFTKMVERHGLKAEILYNYFVDLQTNLVLDDHVQESIGLDWDTPKTPLSLTMVKNEAGNFEAIIEYDARLYNDADMHVLAKALHNFAVNSTRPECKQLNNVSMLSDEQTKDIVTLSTGLTVDHNLDETVTNAIVRRAKEQPDACAIVDSKGKTTYGELDRKSNIIAHLLLEAGVKPNQFVALMMDRTSDFQVSVMGIHKAAAAYTPLDTDYPNERISYMLKDSEATILISKHSVIEQKMQDGALDLEGLNIIYIDDVDFSADASPIDLSTPEGLAYMIYTSGSTGNPKGVMLHHKGLKNFTESLIEVEFLTSRDRIACHRAFSFDAHIGDLYPILVAGGEMHIMPSEIRKDLQLIYEFLVEHRITGAGFTTSLMMLLINNYDLQLRFLTAGGEKLSGVKSDSIRIINEYGPTECTNDSTLYIIRPGLEIENIPIGRPLPNTYSFVVDLEGNLVPQGISGELCVAGVQVGRGYWNLPEQTAKVFTSCPFLPNDENGNPVRMYHTGDLVCYNQNGDLEYMGRIDGQVKLRGFRIEVGEIEAVALQYKNMKYAVAKVCEVNGNKQLVLYYSTNDNVPIDSDVLYDYLDASQLAKYMLPDIFMQLPQMPLLPNGKVNRKNLPAPVVASNIECVEPQNEKEYRLLKIARDLLNRDDFGVTNDLRKLGLTSLLAMKMLAMASTYNINLKVGDLLKYRSIRKLLGNSMSLSCWVNKPEAGKPIVVFIHGVTNFNQSKAYIDALSQHYSVYQIENITDHYDVLFNGDDIEEVAEMYSTLIETFLGDDTQIYAFTGHSFGGELAYRTMLKWSEKTGQKPKLLMLDTRWSGMAKHLDLFTRLIDSLPEDILSSESGENLKMQAKHSHVYAELASKKELPAYDGCVIYERAMQANVDLKVIKERLQQLLAEKGYDLSVIPEDLLQEFDDTQVIDNSEFWREHTSSSDKFFCRQIDSSHNGMLSKEFVDSYVDDLTNKD